MRLVRTSSAIGIAMAAVSVPAPAAAENPVLHDVTYTVSADAPFRADIYYRDTDPPNFGDYSHDPYVFSPKVEANVGPGAPWVLTVRLADPQNWAMVTATSGLSPNPPGFHCTLAVDGQVVATNAGPKGALCSLRLW